MEQTVRILHTADLHIGAPVRGFCDLSDAWAERLQRVVVEAYDRVIDAAIKNTVDFVVLAGDAFDTAHASYGDFLHFFDGLDRLD
ncbi:MAG: metallophosphoesterase, partial [Eggerthellaceae bacterium]|nr:metallophosphoesterase [Eggerthellaceae bacterium]